MQKLFRSCLVVLVVGVLLLQPTSALALGPVIYRITVNDDGVTTVYRTSTTSIGAFFEEQGIELREGDDIGTALHRSITRDMIINITRNPDLPLDDQIEEPEEPLPTATPSAPRASSTPRPLPTPRLILTPTYTPTPAPERTPATGSSLAPVTFQATIIEDGVPTVYRTSASSVGAFLAEEGIELREGDEISTVLHRAINRDIIVHITRNPAMIFNDEPEEIPEEPVRTPAPRAALSTPRPVPTPRTIAVRTPTPTPEPEPEEIIAPDPLRRPVLFQVTVIDNGVSTDYRSTASSVRAFMEEQGIELGPNDELSTAPHRQITRDLIFRIDRAVDVTVRINDAEYGTYTLPPRTTAGEKFAEIEAETGELLIYHGDENEPLTDGDVLDLYTWRSETENSTEIIPFERVTRETSSLPEGEERVVQLGADGERTVETLVVYVGNVEDSREVVSEQVKDPVSEIVEFGIGSVEPVPESEPVSVIEYGALGTLTDTSSPDFQYSRRLEMSATAYTAEYCCTGKRPGDPGYGITASGMRAVHGVVGVNTSQFPYGTRMYIEGYGFAVAADTGSGIGMDHIDLFHERLEDAQSFGRRTVTVYILD